MNNRTLITLLFLLAVTADAVAQRCRVFGTVRDQDGTPIELATVRIPGTAVGTSCDLQGRYSLSFQSRDTIVVQYSMIGYETRKRTLYHPRDSVRIDITLPSYGAMLGEATAVGQGVLSIDSTLPSWPKAKCTISNVVAIHIQPFESQ